MDKKYYDFKILKAIPIQEVAERMGIEVSTKGGGLWCKIRPEDTASCKLYTTTNTFCDFGGGVAGECGKGAEDGRPVGDGHSWVPA